jgi:hypothetical protein
MNADSRAISLLEMNNRALKGIAWRQCGNSLQCGVVVSLCAAQQLFPAVT